MPEHGGSERLSDRAQSAFQQRRQQALQGSTRLRDRADTVFQQRRQQAQRAREAIAEQREQFGEALGVGGDSVVPVQLDDRGESYGFVPDDGARDELAAGFAADRPFVEPEDAFVDADPVDGVLTRTDPDRTDAIASRARADVASDAEFVEADDIDADVGPGGVESVAIAEDRRDVVADRTARGLAAEDPFAEPDDFGVDVGARGIESAGLTDTGARRRAGRQFVAETALDRVDPSRDIAASDDGFTLTSDAQRRVAARGFEDELEQFGRGELDPDTDIRDTNGGFGLGRGPSRQVAADQLDEQLGDTTVRPGDIELEDTGDGFEAVFEREVER